MTQSYLLYRAAGTDGATLLDLTIATYDALARDLNRIALAVSASDIEDRCRWSHHALLLLGYLESWIERLEEPALERSLATFYTFLRCELVRLQVGEDVSSLRKLVVAVCETRATWQQKRQGISDASEARLEPDLALAVSPDNTRRLGWSG